MKRWIPIALAACSVAVTIAFVVVGALCGETQTVASTDPSHAEPAHCISAVNPLAVPALAVAVVALGGVVWRRRIVPLAAGLVLAVAGIVFVASVGFFLSGAGLLAVLAAATMPRGASTR
ncbi:MAG: hypothetical protein ACYDCK_12665 [Thermoplasmatota archaeon]